MKNTNKVIRNWVKRIREEKIFDKDIKIRIEDSKGCNDHYSIKLEENQLYWDIYLDDVLYAKIPDVGSEEHVAKMILTVLDW